MKTAFFIVVAMLALMTTSFSQSEDSWSEQVTQQFREIDEMVDSYTRIGAILHGSLNEMESNTHSFRLRAGQQYALLALCDEDCHDLDLFVLDQSGRELDSDVNSDYNPVVIFTPAKTGDYQVRVRMYSCSKVPCRYGVAVYEAEPESFEVMRFSGSLQEGAEAIHRIRMEPGFSYRFDGVCDSDCEDLDLFISNPNGELLDDNTSVTATPSVSVRPSQEGTYELRVRMYDCSIEPCTYEVVVTRD